MSETHQTVVTTTETENEPDGFAVSNETANVPETVAAAQGAVAVATEAVALSEAVTAEANIAAADVVRRTGEAFEQRLMEVETWRSETVAGIGTLAEAVSQLQSQLSTLQSTTQQMEARLPQTQTQQEQQQIIQPESGAEESQTRQKRHRWI